MNRHLLHLVFAVVVSASVLYCVSPSGAQSPISAQTVLPPDVQLPPPIAPDRQLTLQQAEAIAQSNTNPQISQAEHTVSAANDNYESQQAFMNPTLNYSGVNNTVANTTLSDASNYVLYVPVETNGAEHFRANQAKFQLRGAEAEGQTTRLTIRQAVADAYWGLQVANSQLENEEDVYGLVQKLSDLTHKQFELGAAPQTNAIRADIALTQEHQNLIAAASQVLSARAALNSQLGRAAGEPVDAAVPLTFNEVPIPDKGLLLDLAVRQRPEVKSADAGVDAARANIGLSKAQYVPDATLGKVPDGTPVEVGAVMPIDIGSIHGAVASAREQAKAQEAQAKQARLQVTEDVQNGYVALTQADQTVVLYEQGVLPQTKDLLDRVTKGFALGANTILDIIDAEQTYRSVRNSYYAAIGSYDQAVDQLNRAVGGDFTAATTPAIR
ncbi:MAG: TolC family protein [Capsulimonadaceae bacterium]